MGKLRLRDFEQSVLISGAKPKLYILDSLTHFSDALIIATISPIFPHK